ncbi:MAG: late competence development ComFB family protein [Treponema sp.]|jgi:competence protein ComFB|nr:late competence development ComFB family protein [Treponema sp.]
MDIHNTAEETVIARVTEIFDAIARGENSEGICTCNQCRLDTVCYVLNRTPSRYIVSNRGVARTETEPLVRQQEEADITTLAYEGIHQISHNQRPNFDHRNVEVKFAEEEAKPVFSIPTIVGRLFNGLDFAPMSGIKVELYSNGELVTMKDYNWQNPCTLVPNTEGAFSFWPVPVPASSGNLHKNFEFSIRAEAPGFETLNHFFNVPVISGFQSTHTFSMSRIVKLPDLYMFPPGGEDEENF